MSIFHFALLLPHIFISCEPQRFASTFFVFIFVLDAGAAPDRFVLRPTLFAGAVAALRSALRVRLATGGDGVAAVLLPCSATTDLRVRRGMMK